MHSKDFSSRAPRPRVTNPRGSRRTPDILLFALGLLGLSIVGFQGPNACASDATSEVAQVGEEVILHSELEAFLEVELQQWKLRRQQLLEDGLKRLVEEKLLEQEARTRKLSLEDLLAQEINLKVAPVTDADIDAWYQQNRARVGRPLEQVSDQVRSFLESQRQQTTRADLLASIRSNTPVRLLLDPPRIQIEQSAVVVAKGKPQAPVTIVEFSDFQCPACRKMAPIIDEVKALYGDDVRVEFRHFPLEDIHPDARKASEAALCAAEQDLFWEMHDDLFENQRALKTQQILERAAGLGLESKALEDCLNSERHASVVSADLEAGRKAGVGGTPSIYVNGRPIPITRLDTAMADMKSAIDDELNRGKAAQASSGG